MILGNAPIRTLLAILLFGLLLALPTGFCLVYKNMLLAAHSVEKSPKILLFLNWGVTKEQAEDLRDQIQQRSDVQTALYVSPLEGVKNLTEQLGFGDLLNRLPVNPLPSVIAVLPEVSSSVEQVAALADALKKLPQVTSLQVNMDLMKRQYAYLAFWEKVFYSIIILFAIILLLAMIIIMETFFLLEVKSLAGIAEKSMYYRGSMIGISGAILSVILTAVLFSFLGPALGLLFKMKFIGLDLLVILKLLLIGLIYGLVGTFLAGFFTVSRPIQSIRKA